LGKLKSKTKGTFSKPMEASTTVGVLHTVSELAWLKLSGLSSLDFHIFPTHLMAATRYSREVIADWRPRFLLLRDILIVVWIINLMDWVLMGGALRNLCIPRRAIGFFAIPITPLVHGNPRHLLGNSLYFFVLGWLILLRGIPDFLIVTLVVALADGLGTWLFAEPYPNYGASGITYGYFGFLLFSSFFDRDIISLVLTIVVLIIDRTAVNRLFVDRSGVSLESHMFGFFGGILAIFWLPTLRATFF
jgi:membrane associated rhomboid family serine protease